MKQTSTLQNLLEIALSEEETAASSLGQINRILESQEQKLAMLLQYREDYQERLRRAVVDGLDGAGLKNFNDFIARLEHAIEQQLAALHDARARAANSRLHWQEKRRKSKAFDTLSQRSRAAAVRIENSREQKSQDDFANRATRQKSCEQR